MQEVTVTSILPLNNQKVINFYRTNNFSTIDDITARLESMSLIKRGAYAMEPQLGGFSGGQINVTIDGMKIFGACTDKMDPVTSYVEPSNLKNINVNKGTNACETGCNIGGSIDLTLQKSEMTDSNTPNTSIEFGYESVSNGRNLVFTTGLSHNKLSWGINGVYRKNDNYTNGLGKKVPFSQFEKTNIHTNLQYRLDSASNFKADALFDLAHNVGYPALPMDVSKAQAILLALEYERIAQNSLKVKLYINDVVHVMDDSKRDSTFYLQNHTTNKTDTVMMRMDMPGRSTTLGTYGQYIININDQNRLKLKIDNYTNRSVAEMTMYMHFKGMSSEAPMYMQTWPDMLRNVTGVFVQHSMVISNKLTLMTNGRIDYTIDRQQNKLAQQQFSVLNYNLPSSFRNLTKAINATAKYQFPEPLTTSLTVGWSERMPTNTERFGFYLYNAYDGYDYIGNPYLKTEKSFFSELKLSYTTSNLQLNFSQSASRLTDYILGKTNTTLQQLNFYANGIRIYTNYPGALLLSTNLQLLYQPTRSISFFALTKFTSGKLDSGDPLPLIPPLNNVVAIRYQKTNWAVQAENETSLSQNSINSNYGETRTPAFSVFNLKTNHQFDLKKTKLEVALGVNNLLNNVYYEHLDWGKTLRPGRNINFFFKYTL